MPNDNNGDELAHDQALIAFMRAVADPAQREAAKGDPVIGGIISKLSPDDFETLSKVMANQTLTNHGPLLQRLNEI